MTKTPVTIVTGALGSGKTTFVNHILTSDHGLKIGVIVNEFGAVGIDSELIVSSEDEELIELSNGCMCCTVRGDLVDAVISLLDSKKVDYIVIETSGLSEVVPAAMIFESPKLADRAELDSIITVVDAVNFLEHMAQSRTATEQLETADFVLLNKAEQVHRDDLEKVKKVVKEIVPKAQIIETVRCDVDVRLLLGVGKSHKSKDWKVLEHETAHDPDIQAVSCETGPVDSDKIQEVLDNLPDSIFRAKGILCIKESRKGAGDELRVAFHKVGKHTELEFTRPWEDGEEKKTTVVFIGKGIDRDDLQKKLDSCSA